MKKQKAVRFDNEQLEKAEILEEKEDLSFSELVRTAFDFFWMETVYPLAEGEITEEEAQEKLVDEADQLREPETETPSWVVHSMAMGFALAWHNFPHAEIDWEEIEWDRIDWEKLVDWEEVEEELEESSREEKKTAREA